MAHMYRAEVTTNGHTTVIENAQLPEVTKQVRRDVKLMHGHKVRTALLEEGICYVEGFGRRKANSKQFYHVEITVRRF